MLLDRKLALITGGGRGLGEAIARGMAAEGARVIVADLDIDSARKVAKSIEATGGEAFARKIDVTDREASDTLAAEVLSSCGPIDILVNNAGITGRSKFDDDVARDTWDCIMRVNLQGVFNVTQSFVAALKRTRGCIINMSSISGLAAGGTSTAGYVVSKGGVRSLTQVLARDLAEYGIRANAVAPGIMATDMTTALRDDPGTADWYLSKVPGKRWGEAREIVGPVVFLASSMASYVNGVVLPVDGGYMAV